MWNRKALLLSGTLLLFLVSSCLIVEIQPVQATGAGWINGWLRRKSHIISPATGAGAGYEVCIKVFKAAGADGNLAINGLYCSKVYCGGNCRDDFGDIRFADDDGSTLLPQWIEDNTLASGTSAIFWVKIGDSLETNAQTIYVYYDNPTATTVSDVEHTFLAGDDFDTGAAANTTTWTVSGTAAISAGICTISYGASIYTKITVGPASVAWYGRVLYDSVGSNCISQSGFLTSDAANSGGYYYLGGSCYYRTFKATVATSNAITVSVNNYHLLVADWVSSANSTAWLDGAYLTVISTNIAIVACPIYHSSRVTYGPNTLVDFSVARKYCNPEPMPSTWGSEETASRVILYFNHNSADGCSVGLTSTTFGAVLNEANGTARSCLDFNISATCNGSSLYQFDNFTYLDWSNSTDLNPDCHKGMTANITVWVYFSLKAGGASTYSVARFDFDPSNPSVATEIVFNATQSYNSSSVSFEWNFDDANTTLVSNSFLVVHSYGSAGLYNVSLALHGAATTLNQSFTFYSLNLTADLYAAGWAAGNATGWADGWIVGNASGYASGYSAGYSLGWEAGNATGYSDGWAAGNATGWLAGNSSGYASGWTDGNSTGYSTGWLSGNSTGWTAGYAAGLAAGGGGNRLAYWAAGGFVVCLVLIFGVVWFVRRK